MNRYTGSLSIFRLIILFLFAAGVITLLHEMDSGVTTDIERNGRYRLVYDTLVDCTDTVGRHIGVQEALARALLIQIKLLPADMDAATVELLLERSLEGTPDFIQGVGLSAARPGSEARRVFYRAKSAHASGNDVPMNMVTMSDDVKKTGDDGSAVTPEWAILPNPASQGPGYSCLLSVGFSADGIPDGDVFVRSDMSWLRLLLERIGSAGGGAPVCIAPNGDILWTENSKLWLNKDFPDTRYPDGLEIENIKRSVRGPHATATAGFLATEIFEWRIMVSNPLAQVPPERSWPWSRLLIGFAALLLLCEVAAFVYSRFARPAPPSSGGTVAAHSSGTLHAIYDLLFRYRVTNPERERIESELRVARQIQFSLVPDSFPTYSEWREFDLFSLLQPAREVAGDYYDFFMLDSDTLLFTVGDVSGTGVPAALYMAVSRTAFRTLAGQIRNPGELMTRLNDMLVQDNHSGLYVTIVSFIIHLPTGQCEYVLAGHPAPLWHHPGREGAEFIDSPRESFVGLKSGIDFPIGSLRLEPGDTLLVYSDGAAETRNDKGEEYGYERLRERFAELAESDTCRTVVEKMAGSLRRFAGDEQQDDVTLLAFRYWGPGGKKMRTRRIGGKGNHHAVES